MFRFVHIPLLSPELAWLGYTDERHCPELPGNYLLLCQSLKIKTLHCFFIVLLDSIPVCLHEIINIHKTL